MAETQLPEVVEQIRPLKQDKLRFIYDLGCTSVKCTKQHNNCKNRFYFSCASQQLYKAMGRC
ncbi:hypothetical protein DK880_00067 [Candidatus Cardinium hertigii]|uniref:Uncharacterized protein n=1 Tax=Candidatus Cardinium hertigii TaxID=247481 RepID=A0A2Z3LFN7_9BACT|nr:hypothetical protein DK880_00067 [Candidatus Cardinium hertigii]